MRTRVCGRRRTVCLLSVITSVLVCGFSLLWGGEGVWGEVTPFEKSALGEADALDRKPLARVPMTSMLLNGEGVIKGHANDYEMWNIINQLTWLKWGL